MKQLYGFRPPVNGYVGGYKTMKKLFYILVVLLVFVVISENKIEGKKKPEVLQSQSNQLQIGLRKKGINGLAENKKNLVKLRLIGRKVKLTRDKEESIIDLKKEINARGNYEYKIIDRREKDGNYYFLLVVCGTTMQKPGSGECGGGSECNLIWMKIDNNLKVESIKSILTESCLENIGDDLYSVNDYKVTKGNFSLTCLGYETKDDKVYTRQKDLLYNSSKPEKGIKVKTSLFLAGF